MTIKLKKIVIFSVTLFLRFHAQQILEQDMINRKQCCSPQPGPVGPRGAQLNSVINIDYLFAYSDQTQTLAAANTFKDITLNNTVIQNGWSTSDTINFICPVTGLYLVSFRANINTAFPAIVAAFFNGLQVPGTDVSAIEFDFESILTVSSTFLLQGVAGQSLKLAFKSINAITTITNQKVVAVTTGTSVELRIFRIL